MCASTSQQDSGVLDEGEEIQMGYCDDRTLNDGKAKAPNIFSS